MAKRSRRAFGKGAVGVALWKGSKWFGRKFWPKVERRLASKSKGFYERVLRRMRRQPG